MLYTVIKHYLVSVRSICYGSDTSTIYKLDHILAINIAQLLLSLCVCSNMFVNSQGYNNITCKDLPKTAITRRF